MSSKPAQAKASKDKNEVASKTSLNEIASKIVLIADDEKDVRRILAENLKEYEVKVVHAARGREALRLLDKQEVDCVVLDISMKDGGIETAAKLQEKYPGIPILFLTGYGDKANRDRSAEMGVQVERWIDKDPGWDDKAVSIILETLHRVDVSKFSKAMSKYVLENRLDIDTEVIYGLASSLEPLFTAKIRLAQIQSSAGVQPQQRPEVSSSLEEVLCKLRIWLNQLRAGYDDLSQRRWAWVQLHKIVTEQLWAACEPLTDDRDKYRQQLADQFERAVRKLKSTDDHRLQPAHLDAIALSLERLSSDKVDAYDVRKCTKAWRSVRIETLPSFGKILKEWGKYYDDDNRDGEEDEVTKRKQG